MTTERRSSHAIAYALETRPFPAPRWTL